MMKSMKAFGPRLKTWKALNWMLHQFIMIVYKNKNKKNKNNDYVTSTNFLGLNVPEVGVECESFTINLIGLLVYGGKSTSIFRQLCLKSL